MKTKVTALSWPLANAGQLYENILTENSSSKKNLLALIREK